ncbi:MAG: PIN domain-containing protein [Candidatus Aenigmarchaeota archaeon]|nr:PIN domain-containing protein [Candidatus Aenigmarchaeota archaeon]MDI6722823.1 PIN domain-containing protein [Candidatus Aenigmarchaeota archaeon]
MKGVDTTFIIDVLRNNKEAVVKSLDLDKEPLVFITEANVYEIVSGIWQQKTNKEKAMRDLNALLNKFAVLPLDRKASIKAGQIAGKLSESGKMIDDIDCLAAGILLANGCNTIISRNVKHFGRIEGLNVESY